MVLNGIEYPNQIIDAIKGDTLVVFAGAGVSFMPPTSLPGFRELAAEIAEHTGKELGQSDLCEEFLGGINAGDVPVNEKAARIIQERGKQYNAEHESIYNLFLSPNEIRIVTTNYDKMFEKVAEEKDTELNTYSAPALPLGSDFKGLVHLHGSIDNPKYMVVTDEDFGKAYLTEGYASRFLTALFDKYTILFIGYSYGDTVVRYLTRAISREKNKKMYVLRDENGENEKWSGLGIIPIYYNKGEHDNLVKSLIKLGERSKRGLLEWKDIICEMADSPPRDNTAISEVDYCTECKERAQVLANCIRGCEWARFLDEKGLFDAAFSSQINLSETEIIWVEWICTKIVGVEDEMFEELLYKHSNTISPILAEHILRRIEEDGFDSDYLGRYVVLCEPFISSIHAFRLINRYSQRGEMEICKRLYGFYWVINLKTEKIYWTNGSYENIHIFSGETFMIRDSWSKCKFGENTKDSKELLCFFREKLEELHQIYSLTGVASDTKEPWAVANHVIEDREGNYHEDVLDCLVEQMEQLCAVCEKKDVQYIRSFITDGLSSKSILCRKIFVKLLRLSKAFSADKKFTLFLKNDLFSFRDGKEQVFLLIKEIYNNLSEKKKNELTELIVELDSSDETTEYAKYNWCVWIREFCKTNRRINSMEREIRERRKFQPRKHPELDFWIESCSWDSEDSQWSTEEIKNFGYLEAIKKAVNYSNNPNQISSREGYLKALSKVISDEYEWALNVARILNKKKCVEPRIWDYYFQGVHSGRYEINNCLTLIDKLIVGESSSQYSASISYLVWKLTDREELKEEGNVHEEHIYARINKLWANRKDEDYDCDRVIDSTLNTSVGLLLMSIIRLIGINGKRRISQKYKAFISKALLTCGSERKTAICVVAGHYNYLYYFDRKWVEETISHFLCGNNKDDFVSAWEGYIEYAQKLNRDCADTLSDIFLTAITHLEWIGEYTRNGFIKLFLTLLIYIIREPLDKYIPVFYSYASDDDVVLLLNEIENRLCNMEDESQILWWNVWLKQFFINRIEYNKPKKHLIMN